MKEFTYVGSLRELSNYTFMTTKKGNYFYDYHKSESFFVFEDGRINIILKTKLLPINFSNMGEVYELIVETPVRDLKSGSDVILVKRIEDIKVTINYTLDCAGDLAEVTILLTGRLLKEYIEEKEEE